MTRRQSIFLNKPGSAVLRLLLLAGYSLLVYWLVFVKPAYLLRIYARAKPDFYYLYQPWSKVHIEVILAFAVIVVIYLLAWKTAGQAHGKGAWAVVIGGSLAFSLLLSFQFPYDAADIFDYILHGRMTADYHTNPYLHAPQEYRHDPFFRYVAWPRERSPYGPVWGLLAGAGSSIAGKGVVANVLVYKFISGAFLLASIAIVALLLRRIAPQRALEGTLLFAWNPLVLFETFGNGHNDMVMVFWMLAATWAVFNRRYTLAVLALVLGTLVKFIPILLLPAVLALALREMPGWRPKISYLLRTAGASFLLAALLYAPFWEGPQVITVLNRTNLFTASIPAAFYYTLRPSLGSQPASNWVSKVSLGLTLAFVLWQAWKTWREATPDRFTRSAFNILIFYLLVTCLWFQPWYTLWALAFVPFLQPGFPRNLGLLTGFTSLSKPFIAGPLVFFDKTPLKQPWLAIALTLGTLAIPWLYALYGLWRARKTPALPGAGSLQPAPEVSQGVDATELGSLSVVRARQGSPTTPISPRRRS